ncbi:GNAT family N-acetyltransferase [Oceanobacillus alkalisoli]|uniref:GNAT family N-acetyltransferase n=1 Tax=Oceanobacillus alkalisoli TaxID=2925113 RepID=UPI001EF0FF45|nr:GNAT family N-acetyltransferase [Oceanobacillus alkalisoli]MCF3942095.1 GNAT family N-acetyltransferase [Oceanobacillus alkalisoli]MCG5105045.1 GNAT family N-acetyltransferase [Oceanobacillus alkalisoli]
MDLRIVTTEKERDDATLVRMIVFVKEQHVPEEEELDQYDKTAIHFVGYVQDEPIAASRLRYVDEYGKLERICVRKEFRGKHFGKMIIDEMERKIREDGYLKAKLNAQTHAIGFYEDQGYTKLSDDVFMDAGIPHVTMIKEL